MHRDLLVGIGGCLVVVGYVMRGLGRSARRDQARRRQHELDAGAPDAEHAPDAIDRHLEKWLPRYGAVCVIVGFVLIGLGLLARAA